MNDYFYDVERVEKHREEDYKKGNLYPIGIVGLSKKYNLITVTDYKLLENLINDLFPLSYCSNYEEFFYADRMDFYNQAFFDNPTSPWVTSKKTREKIFEYVITRLIRINSNNNIIKPDNKEEEEKLDAILSSDMYRERPKLLVYSIWIMIEKYGERNKRHYLPLLNYTVAYDPEDNGEINNILRHMYSHYIDMIKYATAVELYQHTPLPKELINIVTSYISRTDRPKNSRNIDSDEPPGPTSMSYGRSRRSRRTRCVRSRSIRIKRSR